MTIPGQSIKKRRQKSYKGQMPGENDPTPSVLNPALPSGAFQKQLEPASTLSIAPSDPTL